MPRSAEMQERLRDYIARVIGPEDLDRYASGGATESVGGDPGFLGSTFESVLAGGDLDDAQIGALEAIIHREHRPALDVVDDSFAAPGWPWAHLADAPIRARLEAVLPSVGRVELPDRPSIPYGGTAFVVGDGLLMTNRHVAELFARGAGRSDLTFLPGQSSAVDFKREQGRDGSILVQVERVVMIHPYWDMALLGVKGLPDKQVPLRISVTHPDDLAGRDVAIIGYPAEDPRNNADLQAQIFNGRFGIKRLQPGKAAKRSKIRSFGNLVDAMTHDSSTLGGNSGSALVDCTDGTIAGLHFAGVFEKENYAVPGWELARDSRVVDAGVLFADGATKAGSKDPWDGFWKRADSEGETVAPAAAASAPTVASTPAAVSSDGTVTVDVPLRLTLRLPSGTAAPESVVEHPWGRHKLQVRPDPDYDNRKGYDPEFLGKGRLRVPVPKLSRAQAKDVTPNGWDDDPKTRHLLPYHHYSVCLSRSRRLAWFTAANIDGRKTYELPRTAYEEDRWFYDPRIPRKAQIGPSAYRANPLDQGHLLRRADNVWGNDFDDAKKGNDDTFHWTNCSPQHEDFNRGLDLWLGIESYVLDRAVAQSLKVSIFNGPVLSAADPAYRDIQIPRSFWKMVVFARKDRTLSASAYLLTQSKLLAEDDLKEAAAFADWNGFQVPIKRIERLTKLSFGRLADHDAYGAHEAVAGGVAIRAYEDLRL